MRSAESSGGNALCESAAKAPARVASPAGAIETRTPTVSHHCGGGGPFVPATGSVAILALAGR